MYQQFIQTDDKGYELKKQGTLSTIIIGGGLFLLGAYLLKAFFAISSGDKTLLFLSLIVFLFAAIIFLKHTRKFIIYPSKKIMIYSSNFLSSKQEYTFKDYEGGAVENAHHSSGIKVGNSFKLHFLKNGKEKQILLGQNVSAKKIRIISEEIEDMINKSS
nr:hypothetical protein [uncultured Flavobacterium sp.]